MKGIKLDKKQILTDAQNVNKVTKTLREQRRSDIEGLWT